MKFSVICISLGSGVRKTIEDLHTTMQRTLRLHEGKWNIPAQCSDIPGRFADLIAAATRSSGQVGVILINGYDKPILDNIEDAGQFGVSASGKSRIMRV
jgi:hypothetical protein